MFSPQMNGSLLFILSVITENFGGNDLFLRKNAFTLYFEREI